MKPKAIRIIDKKFHIWIMRKLRRKNGKLESMENLLKRELKYGGIKHGKTKRAK